MEEVNPIRNSPSPNPNFYIYIISAKNQSFNEIHSVTIFYLCTIPSPPFIPPMPELP